MMNGKLPPIAVSDDGDVLGRLSGGLGSPKCSRGTASGLDGALAVKRVSYEYTIQAGGGGSKIRQWKTLGKTAIEDFLYPSLALDSPESRASASTSPSLTPLHSPSSSHSPSPLHSPSLFASPSFSPPSASPSPPSGLSSPLMWRVREAFPLGQFSSTTDTDDNCDSSSDKSSPDANSRKNLTAAMDTRGEAVLRQALADKQAAAAKRRREKELAKLANPHLTLKQRRNSMAAASQGGGGRRKKSVIVDRVAIKLPDRETGEDVYERLMKRKAQLGALRLVFGNAPMPMQAASAGLSEDEAAYERQRVILKGALAQARAGSRNELEDGLLYYRTRNDINTEQLEGVGEEEEEDGEGGDDGDDETVGSKRLPSIAGLDLKPTARAVEWNLLLGDAGELSEEEWGGDSELGTRGGGRPPGPPGLATLRDKQRAQDAVALAQLRAGLLPETFVANSIPRGGEAGSGSNHTTSLDLRFKSVGDEQGLCLARGLERMPSLAKLVITGNRLTKKSLPSIIQSAPCGALLHLDLSHNDLRRAIFALAAFFTRPNVLQHLDISACRIACQEFRMLCAAFSHGYSSDVAGAEKSASAPSPALPPRRKNADPEIDRDSRFQVLQGLVLRESPCMHLRELLAAKNHIGTDGVEALAAYIANSACPAVLRTANLSWNNVNSAGATLLASAISRNPLNVVTYLDLACNSISELGGQNLAACLYKTVKLEHLLLSQNQLTSKTCFVFSKSLRGHPSMKVLDLSINPLGEAGGRSLFRTILRGLRCFVMMRNCTYSPLEKIFNHKNPNMDSPYHLDLALPYDSAVMQELVMLAEDDPVHSQVGARIFYDCVTCPYFSLLKVC